MAKIREMIGSDIPVAAEILGESEPWKALKMEPAVLQQMLFDSKVKYSTFVAEKSEAVAGVACFIADGILAGGGCLFFLAIRETERRQGLGRQIMGFIERKVFLKADSLFVSVSAANESALRFLGKLGYHKVAEIVNSSGEGAEQILRKCAPIRDRQVRRVGPSAGLET